MQDHRVRAGRHGAEAPRVAPGGERDEVRRVGQDGRGGLGGAGVAAGGGGLFGERDESAVEGWGNEIELGILAVENVSYRRIIALQVNDAIELTHNSIIA
jgi:hypothetical protein